MSTVAVIGATSSVAQTLCGILASKGHALCLVARDKVELDLLAADLQVRYGTQSKIITSDMLDASFNPIMLMEKIGEFDDMVLSIGDMGNGINTDLSNISFCTHINYTLPAYMATLATQHMASKGRGTLAIISSVAGDRGRQSNYAYGSAKAALTAFASGLRNRYAKQGVHVLTVKPGFIDTPMTWGMKSPLIASRDYVAKKIVKAMEKKKNVIYVPCFWWLIMFIICHIPEAIFKKLKL